MSWFMKIEEIPDYPHWSLMGPFESVLQAESNKRSYLEMYPDVKISDPFEEKESEVGRPPVVVSIFSVGESNRILWNDDHVEEAP